MTAGGVRSRANDCGGDSPAYPAEPSSRIASETSLLLRRQRVSDSAQPTMARISALGSGLRRAPASGWRGSLAGYWTRNSDSPPRLALSRVRGSAACEWLRAMRELLSLAFPLLRTSPGTRGDETSDEALELLAMQMQQ